MEAKVHHMIRMTDERFFFDLIEKKMEEQGFEVLETLSPNNMSSDASYSADRLSPVSLK